MRAALALKISATIVAYNEEKNLGQALDSLDFCDETVVVDSGSSDATVEVALARGARVIRNAWPGYAAQKNFAAGAAAHDWILSLDADEAVSPQLRRSIEALRERSLDHAGYQFPRLARYLGRWIRHGGWYPDRKVRLYDRRRGAWRGDFVHESVVVEGSVGGLEGDLLHYTCDSLTEHVARVNRYTDLAAAELRRNGSTPGLLRMLSSPPWAFFKAFAVQQGFRDGVHGLLIAWMAGVYVFLKYAKARTAAE